MTLTMPNSETFSMPPVGELLGRYISPGDQVVDPFARNSRVGTITNDLNPETAARYHMDAREFCRMLLDWKTVADVVLFDPPYSPRQIAEVYQQIGKPCTTEDTQNGALYAEVRRLLGSLLKTNGIAISFGWNSSSFGDAFEMLEIMLVAHGGAHNDTICCVSRKRQGSLF